MVGLFQKLKILNKENFFIILAYCCYIILEDCMRRRVILMENEKMYIVKCWVFSWKGFSSCYFEISRIPDFHFLYDVYIYNAHKVCERMEWTINSLWFPVLEAVSSLHSITFLRGALKCQRKADLISETNIFS